MDKKEVEEEVFGDELKNIDFQSFGGRCSGQDSRVHSSTDR